MERDVPTIWALRRASSTSGQTAAWTFNQLRRSEHVMQKRASHLLVLFQAFWADLDHLADTFALVCSWESVAGFG